MAVNKPNTAVIANYQESVNANGELVLSGIYQGTPVSQTTPSVTVPSALFIDSVNTNFYVVPLEQFEPTFEFVEIVGSVEPTAQGHGN